MMKVFKRQWGIYICFAMVLFAAECWAGNSKSSYTHYVGELYGGGVVFYVYKTAGVEHGLICSVEDVARFQPWSNVLCGAGAESKWDGLSNSNDIVAQTGHTASAAQLCLDYTYTDATGTYNDWYLPSKDELYLIFSQIAIINFALDKASTGYGFSGNYWSSTEDPSCEAWSGNGPVPIDTL